MARGFPQPLCPHPPSEPPPRSGAGCIRGLPVLNLTQPPGLAPLLGKLLLAPALPGACMPTPSRLLPLSLHPLPVPFLRGPGPALRVPVLSMAPTHFSAGRRALVSPQPALDRGEHTAQRLGVGVLSLPSVSWSGSLRKIEAGILGLAPSEPWLNRCFPPLPVDAGVVLAALRPAPAEGSGAGVAPSRRLFMCCVLFKYFLILLFVSTYFTNPFFLAHIFSCSQRS